jgi:cold shock CspA family protein
MSSETPSQETMPTTTSVNEDEVTNVLQYHELSEEHRYAGIVKWFDNKLNFGFVTITHCRDGTTIDNTDSNIGLDIFVHQTNLMTSSDSVFRTLNKLDRIEFSLEVSEGDHKCQAIKVTGPFGAFLNCELAPYRSPGQNMNSRGRGKGRGNRRYPQTSFQRRGNHSNQTSS